VTPVPLGENRMEPVGPEKDKVPVGPVGPVVPVTPVDPAPPALAGVVPTLGNTRREAIPKVWLVNTAFPEVDAVHVIPSEEYARTFVP